MANTSLVTQEMLQDTLQNYHENLVYPFLNGATHAGCVPLGTILPYFGETAPTHFLICDGTEYAKSDYPELAEHLLALTDPTPYAGSDSGHFKVPDLRGEFLRGSGTNGHTNNGNGANVGVHQDSTYIKAAATGGSHEFWIATNNTDQTIVTNPDKQIMGTIGVDYYSRDAHNDNISTIEKQSLRPTNTSVTYIIAYRNAYIDLALDSFPIDISQPTDGQLLMYDATAGRWVNGGHKYSTDEHIVGTWIDGKPVYEKVISATMPDASETKSIAHGISNFKMLISFTGAGYTSTGAKMILPFTGDGWEQSYTKQTLITLDNANIYIRNYGVDRSSYTVYIILRYTKTTD